MSRLGDFVNAETGEISREIFVDETIYKQELSQIFGRTWLFVGHESQIPNPNDFFVSRMGEDSVILTRDRQGEVHVLLNTCRHRGMKVCRYDEGNTPVFTCPYHGWSYSSEGTRVSAPEAHLDVQAIAANQEDELGGDRSALIRTPRMYIYKGSIWACWDESVPDWNDYMGGIRPFLDLLLEGTNGSPGGREVFAGVQKWQGPFNWKLGAENFIGDSYHTSTTHRSAVLSGSTGGSTTGFIPTVARNSDTVNVTISFPQGHGVLYALPPEEWDSREILTIQEHSDPEVNNYFQESYAKRFQLRKGFGPQRSGGNPSTIFPNMSFGAGLASYTVAVWHPISATRTEVWRWYFVDKDMPPRVRAAWLREQVLFSGPGGRVESDDLENWTYATEASKGTQARRYDYHFGQGLGHEISHEDLPGARLTARKAPAGRIVASEQNQLGFYKQWAELMDNGPTGVGK